mmetsp:Transcript_3428/g.5531  ORF Transcript_3428/g.5531 Transcript_3428/m.5531 type:complete len:885 (+) Transcript_3428:141-2795(+)
MVTCFFEDSTTPEDVDDAAIQIEDHPEYSEIFEREFLSWLPNMFGPSMGWCNVRRLCYVPSYPDGLHNRYARNPGFIRFSAGRLQFGTSRWSRRFDVDGLYWQTADLVYDVSAWRAQRLEGQPCALSLLFFGSFVCSSIQAIVHALPETFWNEPLHVSGAYLSHGHALLGDIWGGTMASLLSDTGRLCRSPESLLSVLGALLQSHRVLALCITFSWSSSPGRVTFMGIEQGCQPVLDEWLQAPSRKRGRRIRTPLETSAKKLLGICEASFAGRSPELWLLGCVKGDPDVADIKVMECVTRSRLRHNDMKEKFLHQQKNLRTQAELVYKSSPIEETQLNQVVTEEKSLDSEESQVDQIQIDTHRCIMDSSNSFKIWEDDVSLSSPPRPGVLHSTFALYQKDAEASSGAPCGDMNVSATVAQDLADTFAARSVHSPLPTSIESQSAYAGDGEQALGTSALQDVRVEEDGNTKGIGAIQQWLQDLDDSMMQYFGNQDTLAHSQPEDQPNLESTQVSPISDTRMEACKIFSEQCEEVSPFFGALHDLSRDLEALTVSYSSHNDSSRVSRDPKHEDTADASLFQGGSASDTQFRMGTGDAIPPAAMSTFSDTSLMESQGASEPSNSARAVVDQAQIADAQGSFTFLNTSTPTESSLRSGSGKASGMSLLADASSEHILLSEPFDARGRYTEVVAESRSPSVDVSTCGEIHSLQSACLTHCGTTSPCTLQCQHMQDQLTPPPPPPSPQHQWQLQSESETHLELDVSARDEPPPQTQPQAQHHNRPQRDDHDLLAVCSALAESPRLSATCPLQAPQSEAMALLPSAITHMTDIASAPTEDATVSKTVVLVEKIANDISQTKDVARWQRVLAREAAKYNTGELLEISPLEAY